MVVLSCAQHGGDCLDGRVTWPRASILRGLYAAGDSVCLVLCFVSLWCAAIVLIVSFVPP